MSMTRRRLLDDTFKKSVVGNPAIATGSLARMYPGITMQGWTEQDSTTGAQLFDVSKIPSKTQGGATVTNNGDGSFTITGEGQLTTAFTNSTSISGDEARKFLRTGTLRTNMAGKVPQFYAYARDSDGEVLFSTVTTGASELTDEILGAIDSFYYVFYSAQGSVITPGIVWPMAYQDGDGTWEPYTGGQPSPSPDYPQEIVSAGKYNEDTQKWEYEITITNAQTDPDKNQTVTLTADRPLTKWDRLEKRNGQWGWVYKSNEIVFDGSEAEAWALYNNGFYIQVGLKDITLDTTLHAGSLSDKFHYGRPGNYAYFRVTNTVSSYSPIFYYNGIADVESWRQFLVENNVSYLYPTEAETFVPLSASEQEAMNALHTFRPTTVLSNDCDCNMSLTYKTKKSLEVTT